MKRTCSLVALTMMLSAASALAAEFTASNGAILRAPDVTTLNCAQRGTLLMEYSISEYRGTEPLGAGHPDYPIYQYENRLAELFYADCQAGSSQFQDSAPAFSRGFN